MELTFTQTGQNISGKPAFVSEFQASADFNLHIERKESGKLLMYQMTQGGKYDLVDDFGYKDTDSVIDYDCIALVYPKTIKIVSEVEPTYAAVTTSGEVTEIKSQSKEVEVTANGTMNIKPDAGFGYLSAVKVKTNVPQNGEGGGSSSSDGGRKDVNFFDYDGTLLYAYSWEEAKNLTELPALPVHDGLEVREWNYTLEDIKAQGVEGFSDQYGSYFYVKDVVINGTKYLAYTESGKLEIVSGQTAYALLLTKKPKAGDFAIGGYYYGGDEWELWYDGDVLYKSEVKDVFSTIGKADVGACVYDSEGEQVLGDFVFIIPRGVDYFDSTIYGTAITVLSIPNTVVEGRSQRISYCNIFGEVKIPISVVRTGANIYSFIVDCKVDSIYINGGKTYSDGYYYRIVFRDIYRSQSTFAEEGTIGTSINSNYIKIHPSVNSVHDINLYHNDTFGLVILDFSNHKFIPECISDPHVNDGCTIIVPDELYDEWINATNWSEIKWYIYPASKCKNIIRE